MVRLKIGLDFDDVVAPFNSEAIKMANEKYRLDLKLEDVTSWANEGKASVIKEFYADSQLYDRQLKAVSKEAIDSVSELMKMADVYFISAVSPAFMPIRVAQIKSLFPTLGEDRIILGQAKYLVQFDITLDDNIDNVLNSPAEYPVLMRKPWNSKMTGLLSVNSIPEFVELVKHILDSARTEVEVKEPCVIALVGPSGSGKNAIADGLCDHFSFFRPKSYTDNTSKKEDYNHIFVESYDSSEYIENTMYAGFHYGTKEDEIEKWLKSFNVVLPLDICGAIGMKKRFPTIIVYIDNDKQKIIENIISSNLSLEEKTLRILSLEAERKNKSIADIVIDNRNGNGAEKILSLFNL